MPALLCLQGCNQIRLGRLARGELENAETLTQVCYVIPRRVWHARGNLFFAWWTVRVTPPLAVSP
jgi:hypothetical protein